MVIKIRTIHPTTMDLSKKIKIKHEICKKASAFLHLTISGFPVRDCASAATAFPAQLFHYLSI